MDHYVGIVGVLSGIDQNYHGRFNVQDLSPIGQGRQGLGPMFVSAYNQRRVFSLDDFSGFGDSSAAWYVGVRAIVHDQDVSGFCQNKL